MRRGSDVRDFILRVVLLIVSSFPATVVQAALTVRVVDAHAVGDASHALDPQHLRFVSDAGVEMTLALDPSRLEVTNPLAGSAFVPMAAPLVEAAISELLPASGPAWGVVVYCLPGLPVEVGRSFCRGAEVFLAPGVAPVPANVVAYTVVHELGHAVQHLTMPRRQGPLWEEYLQRRGLTDARVYDPVGLHRNRPQEIFAEDFRVLYGGALANYSGTIENASLVLPQQVEGLTELFARMLAGSYRSFVDVFNAPNPFNPSTTISVVFAAEAPPPEVPVQVLDLRGRRVRTLHARASGQRLTAVWRGRDDAGRPVASGRYFYRLSVHGRIVGGSMLLVE